MFFLVMHIIAGEAVVSKFLNTIIQRCSSGHDTLSDALQAASDGEAYRAIGQIG